MATQKFLVTITDNTDMDAVHMRNLIEMGGGQGARPRGTTVTDVTDDASVLARATTTNLVWKVKQNGNVVASAITAEDALTILTALAQASDGLTGWSLHFDMAVV
jgi:hypothetical protein